MALICVIGLAGCSGGSDDVRPAQTPATTTIDATAPPATQPVSTTGIPMSDFERNLMEDGLTFEEYERAFLALLECVAEFGWIPVEPPELRRNQFVYTLHRPGPAPTPGEGVLLGDDVRACDREYFTHTQLSWARANQMSAKEKQDARYHMGECLRGLGYEEVPEHPSTADWERLFLQVPVNEGDQASIDRHNAFRSCLEQTNEEFQMLPYEIP